ncbi:MAG: TolC family protein [Kiritimatiellae bacterium]|nr:TolC family protein [Kiritimatiellia bacterium]MDW8459036.1 TolC family protein [Verrucomicrobiota bacterium]
MNSERQQVPFAGCVRRFLADNSAVRAMWLLAGFSALAACAAAYGAERLDLETAINRALANNRELAQRALAARGAERGAAAARAEFAWRLRPEISAERADDADRLRYGFSAGRKWEPGFEIEAGPRIEHTSGSGDTGPSAIWRVDVRQPLFRNFGALIQREGVLAAESRFRAARRALEQQKADLALRVVEQFETLVKLERQIAADEAALQRLETLFRLTQARERQGRATRVDTLRVDLRRGEALARLETDRERMSSLRRDFAELLGSPPDTLYELIPSPLIELNLPPTEEAVALALSNRLDYAQALQDYADAERSERIARRGLLPEASLIARAETEDEFEGRSDVRWSIGVSGGSDIVGVRERAQIEQAVLARESAREAVRIREWAIAREVQQSASAYRRARLDVDIAERNHALAEQRARLARRLFDLGRVENRAVTDAEDELAAAESRRLTARAEAVLAAYRYLHALGTLLEAPAELRPRRDEVPP